MNNPNQVINIAEIPYDSGSVRFRYERCLASDGKKWIRHGLFQAYHMNGQIASEGEYENGLEVGIWRDYHETGALAAEGRYIHGKRTGRWQFFDPNGDLEGEEIVIESER